MARDPAHAGDLRERIVVLQRALDANGDALGSFEPVLECAAKIDAQPGPMRVEAARLEGQVVLDVTVRSTPTTRGIDTSMRILWRRNGQTYVVSRPGAEDPRRAWVSFFATLYEGGAGG